MVKEQGSNSPEELKTAASHLINTIAENRLWNLGGPFRKQGIPLPMFARLKLRNSDPVTFKVI